MIGLDVGRTLMVVAATFAVALSGCAATSCDTTQDEMGQKVVCSGSSFSYTLQGARSGDVDSYAWDNPREKAAVNAVFQGAGTIYVTIKDHNGKQVYSQQHSGTGQSAGHRTTEAGEPGTWTIKVETKTLSGQVVLNVMRSG